MRAQTHPCHIALLGSQLPDLYSPQADSHTTSLDASYLQKNHY